MLASLDMPADVCTAFTVYIYTLNRLKGRDGGLSSSLSITLRCSPILRLLFSVLHDSLLEHWDDHSCTLTRWPRMTSVDVMEKDAAPRMTSIDVIWQTGAFLRLQLTRRTPDFCSPLGTIPCVSRYKYSAKPRLRSPKASAYTSKLELKVAGDTLRDARRPGQSDRRGIENSRRWQRRSAAYWCLWKWCRGAWKAK